MIRQAQDRPSAVERTMEALARLDVEQDARRRTLFMDESQRSAVIHAGTFLRDVPTHLKFLPSGIESTAAFANSMPRETGPARSRIGRESGQTPRVQPELALVSDAEVERYMRVRGSFAPSPEPFRSIAAQAGLDEGRKPSGPTRLLEAAIGKEKHDVRVDGMSGRDATNGALGRLAPRYSMPLTRQLERVALELAAPKRIAELSNVSADHMTSGQMSSQTEMGETEHALLPGGAHDGGPDLGCRSPRIAYPRALADRMIANDLTHNRLDGAPMIGADRAGLGDMIGQGDRRANPRSLHPTVDRDGALKSDDGSSSNTATSGAAQEAIAEAAGELERLRNAVRRTIDDLERVRGSVQPPLPSLPVNRGAFRIS
jgi:hypothetical protein